MATAALERRPATWAEYEALGELRAEYIDGEIIVAPFPSEDHQKACLELAILLRHALPDGYRVTQAWGWKPGSDEFGPDVMVYPESERTSGVRFTGTPVLCIEVLSGNRSNDYVTKTVKYAEAGLDHYWIFDPRDRQLDVLVRDGVHYRLAQQVTSAAPAEVSFGIAAVTVDVDQLVD